MSRHSSDSYQEFLASHRTLEASADGVLETIAHFGQLKSQADFRRSLQLINEEEAQQETEPAGLRTAIGRQLQPPTLNKWMVRRLGLACRAAEVALGHTPWHHQIVCALLLHLGYIVELPNGSGKTLAAALAAAVNSSTGNRTHIVTSNDYLSERDLRWMGPLYQLLSLSAGVLFSDQAVRFEYGILSTDGTTLRVGSSEISETATASPPTELPSRSAGANQPTLEALLESNPDQATEVRHETTSNYVIDPAANQKTTLECDIVYGRIETLGLAFLRDNVLMDASEQVTTRRDMLLVDECDAVLLDDLRTPLVISRSVDHMGPLLPLSRRVLHQLAQSLHPEVDFYFGDSINLTYRGLQKVEQLTGVDFYAPEGCGLALGLVNAIKALHVYRRDEHYIVEANQIQLIDQETGRLSNNRRWGDGLHEALEVKEGLFSNEQFNETTELARITIKHFVKTYRRVAGMSGVIGSPEEYQRFYNLESIRVQPYPVTRRDHPDLVYRTKRESRHNAVEEAIEISEKGQPVLINVPTLRDMDELSALFRRRGVVFELLDARTIRNLEEEADCVKRAGRSGAITMCSKLAARGTDIVVDPEAIAAGGLVVIGLERGMDHRYDHQLRGRAGRHGNPGESIFFLSLQDDLMQRFTGPWIMEIMRHLGMEENVAINSPMVTRRIQKAQSNVEKANRASRHEIVEMDDILDRHRLVFYDLRQRLLTRDDLQSELQTMVDNWTYLKGQTVLKSASDGADKLGGAFLGLLEPYFDQLDIDRLTQIKNKKRKQRLLKTVLEEKVRAVLATKGQGLWLRYVVLYTLDQHWEKYLRFEHSMHDEMRLLPLEFSAAVAKYAGAMEDRFDSFFYEVGEQILVQVLHAGRLSRPAFYSGQLYEQ